MSQRQLRVAELIQREVSSALRQTWPTEAALITITVASVSPDLRQCRVGYAVSGDDAERKKARAFLKRVRTQMRGFNIMGDCTWARGKVTRKYIKDGNALVDIEIRGENQRGDEQRPYA